MPDAADDLTKRYRRQPCVRWVRTGVDQFNKPTYGAPSDELVRWTDKQIEYVTPAETRAVSNSVVLIGEDLKPGDRLKLGTIAQLTAGKPPHQQPNSFEIKQFNKVPDRSGTRFLRKAIL